MTQLSAFIESAGILGPGLSDWPHTADALAGRARCAYTPTEPPPPAGLPSVERRRTGPVVKLVLIVSHGAVAANGRNATMLAAIFSSSGDDGHNCNAICEALAGDDRKLSPTRLHDSVRNAPAGCWSIATHAMTLSNVLCAYGDGFAADPLDGLCQVAVDVTPALVIAYDGDYPEPLNAVRPVPDPSAVALILTPEADPRMLARIDVVLTDTPLTALAQPGLEALWHGNATARALSLLEALAARRAGRVVLEYLRETHVRVGITFGTL